MLDGTMRNLDSSELDISSAEAAVLPTTDVTIWEGCLSAIAEKHEAAFGQYLSEMHAPMVYDPATHPNVGDNLLWMGEGYLMYKVQGRNSGDMYTRPAFEERRRTRSSRAAECAVISRRRSSGCTCTSASYARWREGERPRVLEPRRRVVPCALAPSSDFGQGKAISCACFRGAISCAVRSRRCVELASSPMTTKRVALSGAKNGVWRFATNLPGRTLFIVDCFVPSSVRTNWLDLLEMNVTAYRPRFRVGAGTQPITNSCCTTEMKVLCRCRSICVDAIQKSITCSRDTNHRIPTRTLHREGVLVTVEKTLDPARWRLPGATRPVAAVSPVQHVVPSHPPWSATSYRCLADSHRPVARGP